MTNAEWEIKMSALLSKKVPIPMPRSAVLDVHILQLYRAGYMSKTAASTLLQMNVEQYEEQQGLKYKPVKC